MQKYAVGIEQIIWDMEDIKDIDAMHEDQYKRIVVLQGGVSLFPKSDLLFSEIIISREREKETIIGFLALL